MGKAIHIIKTHDVDNWLPVHLVDVDLIEMSQCISCDCDLSVVVTISSKEAKAIRVGVCDMCGYVGYMDRPHRAWIEHFYDTTWDTQDIKTVSDVQPFNGSVMYDWVRPVLDDTLSPSVFEIGTGYGQNLRLLRDAGFDKLYGVENSPHRARLASEYADATVFHEAFGTGEALAEAEKHGPYDLIYSKSVMEHMYDPNLLFSDARKIQKQGGRIIVAVPHIHHEPGLNTLLFLPHLHGFTPDSIALLARKHGYVPEKVEAEGKGLFIRARLHEEAARSYRRKKEHNDYADVMEHLWKERLHLAEIGRGKYRKFLWNSVKDPNKHGLIHWQKGRGRSIIMLFLALMRLFPQRYRNVSMRIVLGVSKRNFSFYVEPREKITQSPIELYSERLTLYYK